MTPLTLRARVLAGAILWTTGLFALAALALNYAVVRHPEVPVVFHATFKHDKIALIFALACLVVGLLQVRRGLSPINRLRERLAAVRDGRETRLGGSYPAEIQPLVDDLNALIADREQRVARAMARAGDLAHGLKTPLAILANETRYMAGPGAEDTAATIAQQVERMRRQIDRHLAQARASASGPTPAARAPIAPAVDALIRTLLRLYVHRSITIEQDTPDTHVFRGQREDLEEMLGNLLDNACKSARGHVVIESSRQDGTLVIDVDDDGPGIAPALRGVVLQRGVKADEAAPGSGLGLAIVSDLAEIYGGGVTLEDSPLGGLRARLRLPATDP